MRFLSVCSGIEAASVAWNPLGWKAAMFSEIEPFPCSVLAHHYPNVPNRGDMTKFEDWPDESVDLLCGGTPCQSFSVAGLRKGLDDPRGNLMLTYGAIAAKYRPRWLVWENVPGVLSSNGGRDFGSFLGLLGQLGYGFAYRVLDAQHFGVPQRRRRVFVVGCLGDWRSAAAVLFERHSLSGHPAPSRQAGKGLAAGSRGGAESGGWPADVAATLNAAFGDKQGLEDQHALHGASWFVPDVVGALTAKGPTAMGAPEVDGHHYIAHSLRGEGFDASEDGTGRGTGRGTPLVPVGVDGFNGLLTGDVAATMGTRGSSETASGPTVMIPFDTTQMTSAANRSNPKAGDPCHTLAKGGDAPAIAFTIHGTDGTARVASEDETAQCLRARPPGGIDNSSTTVAMTGMQVRRLTPTECERLQGFPDSYTAVPHRGKPAADGPRYKALGNSWAVPCARWIGERINAVEQITAPQQLEAA